MTAAARTLTRSERRENTERSLLDALIEVVLDVGFDRATVEAVANRAQCNKVLIYRYFGGLDGMITALATDDTFVPNLTELCGGDVAGVRALPPKERLVAFLRGYARALQARPMMGYLMLTSVVSDSPALRAMSAQRARQIRGMLRQLDLSSRNVGLDLSVVLHILWSTFMVCAASEVRDKPGGPSWSRLEKTIIELVANAHPEQAPSKKRKP